MPDEPEESGDLNARLRTLFHLLMAMGIVNISMLILKIPQEHLAISGQ